MREIKFRVWDKKRKEYFRISKLWNGDTDPSCFSADDWVDNYGNCGNMKDIVVEQFTGLYDKDGKEIYEGDLVKYTDDYGSFFISEVKYFADVDGYPAFDITSPSIFDWDFESNLLSYGTTYNCLTVVGNIHENADLLEVSK